MTEKDTLQVDQNEAQTEALKRRLAELEEATAKLTAERDRALAGQAIAAAAAASGVLPNAIQDAVARVLRAGEWRTDNTGRAVLLRDGFPNYDGNCDVITPDVYLRGMRKEVPFYWADESPAHGIAAAPLPAGTENPWAEKTWNLTKQGQIMQSSPELAQRLAAEVGTTVVGTKRKP